jgi:hypothetical protein
MDTESGAAALPWQVAEAGFGWLASWENSMNSLLGLSKASSATVFWDPYSAKLRLQRCPAMM